MRFSDSTSKGVDTQPAVSSERTATSTSRREMYGKFVLMNLGLGFLSIAGLGLWVLQTQRFSSAETLFASAAVLPVVLATFVMRGGSLRGAQTASLAVFSFALTVLGVIFQEFWLIFLLGLSLLPAMALTHESKYRVYWGCLFATLGMFCVFALKTTFDPLLATSLGGLLVLSGTFCFRASTKLEKYRAQLNAERVRFDLLSSTTSEMVSRHDRNGKTLYVSAASYTLLGLTPKDLLNTGLCEKTHLQDRIVLLNAISDAVEANGEQVCEVRIRCKGNGAELWKWVAMRCTPAKDPVSGASIITAVTTDISQLRSLSAHLESTQSALEDSLDAQHVLTDAMQTSLQEPLRLLVDSCKVLNADDAGHQKIIAAVHKASDNFTTLLDSSRLDAGSYKPSYQSLTVRNVVNAAFESVHVTPTCVNADITIDIDSTVSSVWSDRHSLTQILSALIRAAKTSSGARDQSVLKIRPHGHCIAITLNNVGSTITTSGKTQVEIASKFSSLLGGKCEVVRHGNTSQSFRVVLPGRSASAKVDEFQHRSISNRQAAAKSSAQNATVNHPDDQESKSEGVTRARISA